MSMPVIESSKTSRCQAISDVIEGIALEEAAFAHILNAEGEELQKVVTFCDLTAEDIVVANNSVIEVIMAVATAEKQFKEILEMFSSCLCDCMKHRGDND